MQDLIDWLRSLTRPASGGHVTPRDYGEDLALRVNKRSEA